VAKLTALLVALLVSLLGGGVAVAATSELIVVDTSVDAQRMPDNSLKLNVDLSNPTKGMSIVSVPVTLTVKDAPATDWTALWWFLVGFAALVAVIPPYLTWLAFPLGNARTPSESRWADVRAILGKLGSRDVVDKLKTELPGISSDWNFKDNWASNVGLAASVFTGVFAAAGPLGELVGPEATSALAVVAVAAAASAAMIGSGPLWLTIFKRRSEDNQGYARHNTVAGVLVASFFVLLVTICVM
jgi:hypothetical protein